MAREEYVDETQQTRCQDVTSQDISNPDAPSSEVERLKERYVDGELSYSEYEERLDKAIDEEMRKGRTDESSSQQWYSKYIESLEFTVSLVLFGVFVTAPLWSMAIVYTVAEIFVGQTVAIIASLLTAVVVFALTTPHLPGEQS